MAVVSKLEEGISMLNVYYCYIICKL